MGYGLWVTGYGLWVTGYGLRVTGYGLRVTGYGLWVTGYGLWVMGYGLRGFSMRRDRKPDNNRASLSIKAITPSKSSSVI